MKWEGDLSGKITVEADIDTINEAKLVIHVPNKIAIMLLLGRLSQAVSTTFVVESDERDDKLVPLDSILTIILKPRPDSEET